MYTLYTPTDRKISTDAWRPNFTQDEIAAFEPDLSNVTFDESVRGFKVDGSNKEQIRQFGRALALRFADVWELLPNDLDTPPATYCMYRVDGRMIEATVYEIETADKKLIKYADLYERDGQNQWTQHRMVGSCIRNTINNRSDKTQPIVAYTKYHLLVKLIQDVQITIINGNTTTIDNMVDAFRSELSILCGYAWKYFQNVPVAA